MITSDHFPILLRKGTSYVAKRPFGFENVWLDDVFHSKQEGGLGIRPIRDMNKAPKS